MRDGSKALTRRSLLLGLALSALVGTTGRGQALISSGQATVPAEKVLPANTLFMTKIEKMESLREGFLASQIGQLMADPGMKPFMDKLHSILEKPSEQLKEAVGLTVPELLTLPQGQVFVSLIGQTNEKVPVALFISADAGTNAAKMAEFMAAVDKVAEQQGAGVATDQFEGLTLHVITNKDDATAPPMVWAQNGTVFHIASSPELMKEMASHPTGRENSLATNELFGAVTKKLGTDPQVSWFLDIQQALGIASQMAGQNGVDADTVTAQIQQLGLNGLKAMGGRYDLNQGDFDSVYKMFVYAPSPVQGVLKMLAMPTQDLSPEPWVPGTVASYQATSLDLDATWKAITELADTYAPGVLDQVEQGLAAGNGGGLKFKDDLIGPLGKRITVVSDFKKPITEASQRGVVAVALDDSKAFQNTLNKIFELAGATPKQRSFQGTNIYDFDVPPEMAQQGITGPISLAIAKDQLYVAFEPTLLEQILRGGYTGLAENPEYQAVSKHFPAQTSILSFARPEDAARSAFGMLGSDQFKAALQQSNPGDSGPIAELLDPTLLPEFSVIAKYLSPQGGFGIQGDDGVTFTRFTVKKGH